MNEISYIGEHLLPGRIGHLLTITNMVAAFMAMVSYYLSAKLQLQLKTGDSKSWRNMARTAFAVHGLSVVGIIAIMFWMILNHYFEYKYVWEHSSLDLPVYYMVSCFWEGQEGSFLLWAFWIAVLGAALIRNANRHEARVMTFVCATQVFLAAMLLGIYLFGYKVGSSPFLLMREDQPNLPVFQRADYVNLIGDGSGLNPLLQNYWMVIHPPTLFLGFAATLMPFAYTLAGLWERKFGKDWVLPTLNWSLFAGGILGIGILMGGAWAYEALSFGGFWAWDPVENASLVPWIALLAGLHTLLIYKHTGRALKPTLLFLITANILVLYSTFLTRSGVLGDTSVHSFTDLGMSGQLLLFLFSFMGVATAMSIPSPKGKMQYAATFAALVLLNIIGGFAYEGYPGVFFIGAGTLFLLASVAVLIYNIDKHLPAPEKEEAASSREFWMFVGGLVMFMFSAIIILDTSWPVINKLFGTKRVITDAVSHFNSYSLWFGVVIGLLSAVIQYLRYKGSSLATFAKKLLLSTALALGFTVFSAVSLNISHIGHLSFLFVAFYVIFANAGYIFSALSGKLRVAGGSVAHIGFGLMLAGILFSSAKQEVISVNAMQIDYGESFPEDEKMENILLYKDMPIQMGDYWVTYQGDSTVAPDTYYKVRYELKKAQNDTPEEVFTLYPNAQKNPRMGLLANPDTRHYLTKDIFTHVSSVANNEQEADDGLQMKELELAIGDTALTNGSFVVLTGIDPQPFSTRYTRVDGDIAAGAKLKVLDMSGGEYEAEPIYYIRDNAENHVEATVPERNMMVRFDKIFPEKGSIKLTVFEKDKPRDFIIMKAIVFPFIKLLWLGCLVMFAGFMISLANRRRETKRLAAKTQA